jgi:FAD/FMN-containing dehydrogenase
VSYDPYFYPLDAVQHWNRIYGRRGFTQYQCVLPADTSATTLRKILQKVADAGSGSFLAVLKRLGPAHGLLSFPMEGFTLALDFPVTADVLALLTELDVLVAEAEGRLYLTKDARMSARMMSEGYPELDAFQHIRHRANPTGAFRSCQSQRLGLDP